MNRRTFLQTTMSAIAVTACEAYALPSIANRTNLLMLAWDSVGLPHAKKMLNEGKLPNLKAVLNELITSLIPLAPTGASLTLPVWTEIFTGLTARQTGVFGNHTMKGRTIDWANYYDTAYSQFSRMGWFSSIPYEHTLQGALSKAGWASAWLTSKSGYLGCKEEQSPLACIAQNAQLFRSIKPRRMYDPYMIELAESAIDFLAISNQPTFIFLHLNPDMFGHLYGGESPEYEHEIQRCDKILGWLMRIMNRSQTHLMVISDHGFDGAEFRHLNAPWSWMATDLTLDERWQRGGANTVDVYATILDTFGITIRSSLPQIRGKSLK